MTLGCRTTVMLIVCLLTAASLRAETAVQSERAHRIALLIWQSQFTAAIDSCKSLVRQESFNPLGYCLLGITFHSINSQYRTDRYADSVIWNLDTAIALADQRVKAEGKRKDL
ncbi:MAG TPA: hypothetical protein VJ983_01555, partial [candidate division Zixibacteria bacterium]|nr:hypothetical protein [candidate division Zixibacteria bacterium]